MKSFCIWLIEAPACITKIALAHAFKKIKEGVLLIDVRDREEFETGHIRGYIKRKPRHAGVMSGGLINRSWFQYGRALEKGSRMVDAIAAYNNAAKLNSDAAYNNIYTKELTKKLSAEVMVWSLSVVSINVPTDWLKKESLH